MVGPVAVRYHDFLDALCAAWTPVCSRMDLLRAAMVGPAGTPYHDGLFFFDIKLPHDYPATPPQVRACYAT